MVSLSPEQTTRARVGRSKKPSRRGGDSERERFKRQEKRDRQRRAGAEGEWGALLKFGFATLAAAGLTYTLYMTLAEQGQIDTDSISGRRRGNKMAIAMLGNMLGPTGTLVVGGTITGLMVLMFLRSLASKLTR